jgi:hypothetical protein
VPDDRPFLRSLIPFAWMIGLVCVIVALALLITGFVNGPRMNRAGICGTSRHHNCFEALDGRVIRVGGALSHRSTNSVTVSYDDGRSEATLGLRGDAHPPAGAVVDVELWGGVPVALRDRNGRLYKDALLWPVEWDVWAFVMGGAGIAVILLASVPWLRSRRRSLRDDGAQRDGAV